MTNADAMFDNIDNDFVHHNCDDSYLNGWELSKPIVRNGNVFSMRTRQTSEFPTLWDIKFSVVTPDDQWEKQQDL